MTEQDRRTRWAWRGSDMIRRSNHGKAKLTPQQRYDIGVRLAEGEDANDLATEYGMTRRSVLQYRR